MGITEPKPRLCTAPGIPPCASERCPNSLTQETRLGDSREILDIIITRGGSCLLLARAPQSPSLAGHRGSEADESGSHFVQDRQESILA